ncbi:hypothetical protein HHI36_005246, partial [Cryptolaemus montrouzieri]
MKLVSTELEFLTFTFSDVNPIRLKLDQRPVTTESEIEELKHRLKTLVQHPMMRSEHP